MDNFYKARWKKRIAAALAILLIAGSVVAINVRVASAQFDIFLEVTRLLLGDGDCEFSTGTGDPNGVVTGDPCDLFLRTDGGVGTIVNVKETGTGTNTGWAAAGGTIGGSGTAGTMTRFLSASVLEDASMTDAEVVTGDTTDVFTNKTYDVEATGNVFTFLEKRNLDMGTCVAPSGEFPGWSVPGGAAAATPSCVIGTNTVFMVYEYSNANTNEAQHLLQLPVDLTGSVDVEITWFSPSTTGSVVWQLATACVAVGESGDPVFNTADTVTDATQGVANTFNEAVFSAITTTGCAPTEILFLQVLRDPADGSDDLGAVANLVAVALTARRTI